MAQDPILLLDMVEGVLGWQGCNAAVVRHVLRIRYLDCERKYQHLMFRMR